MEQRALEQAEKKKNAREDAVAKKRERIETMVHELKDEISDDIPWKDALFEYRVLSWTSRPPIEFKFRVIQHHLGPFVAAPSKGTKNKLTEVKNSLLEFCRLVRENHFDDFSFLSSNDPMESALREYFCNELPGYEQVGRLLSYVNKPILELLRQKELLEALEDAKREYDGP